MSGKIELKNEKHCALYNKSSKMFISFKVNWHFVDFLLDFS